MSAFGEIFLIGVGLSMDAFAVSICKGLAMKKANLKNIFIVGLWFGGFQALMPAIGYVLGVQFKDKITTIDHWIAFVLLSIIGLILTISLVIFILNYTKDSSSLSILEKNWINNNSNNIYDFFKKSADYKFL